MKLVAAGALFIAAANSEGAENQILTLLLGLFISFVVAFAILKMGEMTKIRDSRTIAFLVFLVGAILTLFMAF